MNQPDQHDDLNKLFAQLRESPPLVDPTHIAPGFETRVLARVQAAGSPDALRWFWRWSVVFGMAAAIFVVLVVQNYNALNNESLAALESGSELLAWSF